MKKLLVPLLVALISGVAGGTALTVLRADKAAAIDATLVAAKQDTGSHAPADSGARDETAADTIAPAHADSIMTPAESLRAVVASRLPLKAQAALRGLPDAADAKANTASAPAKGAHVSATSDSLTAKPDSASRPQANAPSLKQAAEAVRTARSVALATSLPEERLAKIFSAMQAKDAARVLDQMEDRDIRAVLSLMGDRQVAAILSALPAPRAATITRGAIKASGADK
jgi:flagellar motility protein MotE (MotC chaperone)